jgi:phage/conjugal plasmid C-4 type zinc finger TraR family protein
VDIFDQAQERDALFRENALKNQLAKTRPIVTPGAKVTKRNCKDCGDPIPKKRLKAKPGAERCIECQTNYEQRRD